MFGAIVFPRMKWRTLYPLLIIFMEMKHILGTWDITTSKYQCTHNVDYDNTVSQEHSKLHIYVKYV